MIYVHKTTGRTPRNALILLGILSLMIGLRATVGLALFWVILVGVFLLPLAWDLITDRRTRLEITPDHVAWERPAGDAHLIASDIAKIDLRIRLDQSVKMQITLMSGAVRTAPPEALPDARTLEDALKSARYDVRRHPFALI